MNTKMKQQLMNDVLTGLLVAAVFTTVIPVDAFATSNFSSAVTNAQTQVAAPFVKIVSYISYILGAILTVAGIAGAKKHADNPGQNPLAPVLGRLGAGAAFIGAPFLITNLSGTGSSLWGSSTSSFTQIGF